MICPNCNSNQLVPVDEWVENLSGTNVRLYICPICLEICSEKERLKYVDLEE